MRGPRPRSLLTILVALVLLGVEVGLGRSEWGRALRSLRSAYLPWVAIGVACTLISMQCFARAQRFMLRAATTHTSVGPPSLAQVVRVTYSANALSTTMPAGGPISVVYMLGQFRTWGLSYATAAFAVVASGVLSTITFAGLAAGCGLATGRTDVAIAVAVVATVAIAVTYVARRSFGLAPASVIATLVCRMGKMLARISSAAGEALQMASVELASIRPRQRDWAGAGGFAALNWIADFASLIAAAHAVPGVSAISVVVLLAAYLAGMSASSVAVLPGGFGVVEIAMIATLHAGGLATAAATATVLLYRLASCVLVVAIGWLTMASSAAARSRAGAGRLTRS